MFVALGYLSGLVLWYLVGFCTWYLSLAVRLWMVQWSQVNFITSRFQNQGGRRYDIDGAIAYLF